MAHDLYISEEMVMAGVFCDPVNHRGNYEYQAYINQNKLYSNYYFKPQAPNRFFLYGYEMYPVNQSYSYGLRRYVVGAYTSYTVSASATQFDHNFAGDGVYFGYKAYFFIDGTSPGATVSIYGTMETY